MPEFYGSAEITRATAKVRLVQIAEEIIALPGSDPIASMKVPFEIEAEFPSGVSDQVKRAVSENANVLNFKRKTWE